MAAPIVSWVCHEFSRFGIDVSEENARYILSMEDEHDLEEYMFELLDKGDAKCRKFVNELLDRWKPATTVPDNLQVYRKPEQEDSYFGGSPKKKSSPKQAVEPSPPEDVPPFINGFDELTSSLQSVELEPGVKPSDAGKKKQKFVPLYSQEGKARTTIQLPGRHGCECQASKHKLINNCVGCGRVVCGQEGSGPCIFCGQLVCTQEEQEVISRGSKKSEKLRQYLMGGDNREYLPSTESKMQSGFEKALQHKERLLEYDKTSVSRTKVIDDESDYFSTDSNRWLSKKQREALRKREEELRAKRHASRKDRKVTLDFAGRQVLEAEEENSMYDINDRVVQEIHYGARPKQGTASTTQSNSAHIINPTIKQPPPKFILPPGSKSSVVHSSSDVLIDKRSSVRLQDREIQEMSDTGMCLSMHQPWASLLVCGIKKHEGRTWYSAHRGRLWIAATAKSVDKQDVEEVEQFYQQYYNDPHLLFPPQYPSGCLLGCVDMTDCLGQEEYRLKFPDGESASPYVFICDNPLELVIKFPMKGKHKLYKLDSHIHQGAKKGLRTPLVH